MATQLLGTDAVNSLTCLVWHANASQADARAINVLIRDDQNARRPLVTSGYNGGFIREGLLFVPNRGELRLYDGDVVAVDATSGQVILLSAYGLSAGPWTLT